MRDARVRPWRGTGRLAAGPLAVAGALLLALGACSPPPSGAGDGEPSSVPAAATGTPEAVAAAWDRVLARHVRAGEKNGLPLALVDYRALAAGDRDLAATRQALAAVRLAGLAETETLALWINAYNALAVAMVAEGWPTGSIRDLGGLVFGKVWDRPTGEVGGRQRTLDEIEHRILRPLGEPRIHFAIVCASVSCPDLAGRAYRADGLEAQLDAATRAFLAHPGKGLALDRERGVLTLSPIFDWFEEDFAAAGGVVAFVRRHAPADVAAWLALHPRPTVRWLDYDWDVNGP